MLSGELWSNCIELFQLTDKLQDLMFTGSFARKLE